MASHKLLNSGQLQLITDVALYTVPGSTTGMIKTILLHNTHTGDATAEIFYKGSTTSTAAERILKITLSSNESFEYAVGHMIPLQTGEVLRGKSDTDDVVNFHIFGAEE